MPFRHALTSRRSSSVGCHIGRGLVLAFGVSLLAGCGTGPSNFTALNYDDTTSEEARLLGDFLVGSYANDILDSDTRADFYFRAYERDPLDPGLARRALTAAISDGNLSRANKVAREIEANGLDEPMMQAFLGAEAFNDGDYAQAGTYFNVLPNDVTIYILSNLMQGWNQFALGDPTAARATFQGIGGGPYFDLLGQLQIAAMEAKLGDMDAANEAFESVLASGLSPIETQLSRARALSDAGQISDAREALEAFNQETGPFENGPVPAYLSRLEAGQPLNISISPQGHASRAITEAAYGFFLRNQSRDGAELYLRFALMLDPDYDKAKLWLGALVEGDDRDMEAKALYESIDEDSAYTIPARLSVANIYFGNDDDSAALKLLERTYAEYPSFTTREALGRARLIREKYAEALPIYNDLIEGMSEQELKDNLETLYFRGICYERTSQWELAVADFRRVLEIDPDNADALNYLGYSWVDRNENLEEAFDMIRRAVELEPDSGAIVDSLGWAHYKLGQYSDARIHLEKAASLSPSSATIIDHLGDVYWRLGRFREAGYQWERALTLDPTDKERADIEKKLEGGLSAVDSDETAR